MNDAEKFEAFKQRAVDWHERIYGREAREKYGDRMVDAAQHAVLELTPEKYEVWKNLGEELQGRLEAAVRSGADPAGAEGQAVTQLHRRWLSMSGGPYDPAKHRGIAELYVADERFAAYYDKDVPGCARFLRDAVLHWAG